MHNTCTSLNQVRRERRQSVVGLAEDAQWGPLRPAVAPGVDTIPVWSGRICARAVLSGSDTARGDLNGVTKNGFADVVEEVCVGNVGVVAAAILSSRVAGIGCNNWIGE